MAYDIPHLRELDRLLPATRTTRPDIARSHIAAIFAGPSASAAATCVAPTIGGNIGASFATASATCARRAAIIIATAAIAVTERG